MPDCRHLLNGTGPVHACPGHCALLFLMAAREPIYRVRDYLGRVIVPSLIEHFDETCDVEPRKQHKARAKGTPRRRVRRVHKVG